MKRWLLKRTKIDTAAMARDLGIRRATAAVLANRELSSRQAARSFLYGGTAALGNPLEMKDFSQAVSLLAEAIRAGKRIAVYGDYDVDGVMSTSILYQTMWRQCCFLSAASAEGGLWAEPEGGGAACGRRHRSAFYL